MTRWAMSMTIDLPVLLPTKDGTRSIGSTGIAMSDTLLLLRRRGNKACSRVRSHVEGSRPN